MKKRSLLLKIVAIANALLITAAFVGCPARKDPVIVTIAPAPPMPQDFLPSDQTPLPTSQDSKDNKRSP